MELDEDLLTQEEIQQILIEAQDPRYSNPHTIYLGPKNKTSIFMLSRISGLILITGNDWTGYNHILLRHSHQSRKSYWNNEGRLDNPSKFPLSLAPIDYLNLASQIFTSQFKNDLKNSRPDIFELYIGNCKYYNNIEAEYKLLTYTGTGIIHTFYVSDNKKPFNNKKNLDLKRGWVGYQHDLKSNIQSYYIKYSDQENIERFKVIIRYIEFIKIERWYIQVNTREGNPLLTTFIKENSIEYNINGPLMMNYFNFSDLSWVEKIIKQTLSESYKF